MVSNDSCARAWLTTRTSVREELTWGWGVADLAIIIHSRHGWFGVTPFWNQTESDTSLRCKGIVVLCEDVAEPWIGLLRGIEGIKLAKSKQTTGQSHWDTVMFLRDTPLELSLNCLVSNIWTLAERVSPISPSCWAHEADCIGCRGMVGLNLSDQKASELCDTGNGSGSL